MEGIELLARARAAGLIVRADGKRLVIRGPKRLEPLARTILENKAPVLRLLREHRESEGNETNIGGLSDAVMGPWRVVIDRCAPCPGSVELDVGMTTTKTALCIEETLIALERAVANRNVGRDSAFRDLVNEYVSRLGACGCRVRVETVS